MHQSAEAVLVESFAVLDDRLHELVVVDAARPGDAVLSILFEDYTAVSALLLLWWKQALLGRCVMSQSFIHCWKTPLIIWGPPSVVMWSGMFHVAQKSFKMVTKCWPSNLPGGVGT